MLAARAAVGWGGNRHRGQGKEGFKAPLQRLLVTAVEIALLAATKFPAMHSTAFLE